MVRGNWQRRVELNESRRADAKQRKSKNEEKKTNKAKAQKAIEFIDKVWELGREHKHHSNFNLGDVTLWIDVPSNAFSKPHSDVLSPLLDVLDWTEDIVTHPKSKRSHTGKTRAPDIEVSAAKQQKSKRKPHPRSHQHQNEVSGESAAIDSTRYLCAPHFFFDACPGRAVGKSDKPCPLMHYKKKFKTLGQVLGVGSNEHSKESLTAAREALPEYVVESSSGTGSAMNLVCSLCIPVPREGSVLPSEQIKETFSRLSLSVGNIQYLTIDKRLVFDRYIFSGIMLLESELLPSLDQQWSQRSEKSQASALPGSILEYILTFLPDTSVSTMSSVCRAWHGEIGKQSSHVWQHLLRRRGWPCQEIHANYRETFITTYCALRDLNLLGLGIKALLSSRRSEISTGKYAVKDFEAERGSSNRHGECIATFNLSPVRVLAAYAKDCTLRIYEANAKCGQSQNQNPFFCREIVSHCVDPFRNTRRRTSCLVDVSHDDETIGCLLRVESENCQVTYFFLVVVKEDFLASDDPAKDDILKIYDIKCLLVSSETGDSITAEGSTVETTDDIQVHISSQLVACGRGRYVCEASLSTSGDLGDEIIICRKILCLNAANGSLQTMSENIFDIGPMPSTLATSFTIGEYHRGVICVATSTNSHNIAYWQVGSGQGVDTPHVIEGILSWKAQIIPDPSWHFCRPSHRAVVVRPNEIVTADSIRRDSERMAEYRTFLSFHGLGDNSDSQAAIPLTGNLEILQLCDLRTSHLMAICRYHASPNPLDFEGEWFGLSAEDPSASSIQAVIVDSHSRTEVSRLALMPDQLENFRFASSDKTFAAACNTGVILAGQDMTTSPIFENVPPLQKSKKKKKLPKKSSKKDAFARGMSLRG